MFCSELIIVLALSEIVNNLKKKDMIDKSRTNFLTRVRRPGSEDPHWRERKFKT
jgi:hypothetical protein